MRKETDRFKAVANDGTTCTIVEYTSIISRAPLSGAIQRGGGPIDYETDSGAPVNEVGENVYEVLDNGKEYTRE